MTWRAHRPTPPEAKPQGGTTVDRRKFLLKVLGVVAVHSLWTRYSARDRLDVALAPDGPLTAYRLQPATAVSAACRSAACAVVTVKASEPDERQPVVVRYLAPAELRLTPPRKDQFFAETSASAQQGLQWVTGQETLERRFPLRFELRDNAQPQASPQSPAPFLVPTAGYVRAALVEGSDDKLLLNGQLVGAANRPTSAGAPKRFSALIFQSVPRILEVEVPLHWRGPIEAQSGLGLGLVLGTQVDDPLALRQAPGAVVWAGLVSFTAQAQSLRLKLRLDDNGNQQLVIAQMQAQRSIGGAALPTQAVLELHLDESIRKSAPMVNVPASTLVRDAQGLRVWTLISDHAIPVAVQELRRMERGSLVIEQPLTLGVALRPADWRAMDAAARAALMGLRQHGGRLLSVGSQLIQQPNADLRPGARVRVAT